jgi:hypothetical protein
MTKRYVTSRALVVKFSPYEVEVSIPEGHPVGVTGGSFYAANPKSLVSEFHKWTVEHYYILLPADAVKEV